MVLRALLAMLVLTATPLRAQSLHFRHLRAENGLSSSWVRAIAKDSRGFVWFATDDGLNRYDGAQVVVYRPRVGDPNSLASSVITTVFEDSHQRLWLGLGGNYTGEALYDRDQDRFQHVPIGSK